MLSSHIQNPLIKEFNSLKKFFRTYETPVSRERIADLKNFTSMITSSGDKVAFDLLGSVNFGQAETYSDADLIVYLECDEEHGGECEYHNCRKYRMYKKLLMNTLVYRYAENTYKVDFVDCINLKQLDRDIQSKDTESVLIAKFGFYRSICRGINKRVLRPYENMLVVEQDLMDMVESYLEDFLRDIIHTSQHFYSFKKYLERVAFRHGQIPESVLDKIQTYLSK